METIPNTTNYMIAGFGVSFLTMGLYILSIYIRNKNLQRDLETLEAMDTPEKK
jgi:hypothetical protein